MPRPRKIFINNTVLFVTTSLEEGLLMPPNSLINVLLKSALARAQFLHPVTICHFAMLTNHAHFILSVRDPEDVKGFMERFKTESAHYLNHLLGRKKRTVWCDGYDSPVLLTPEDAVEKIAYIYANPAKDNLEDSIDDFPGFSSWEMFVEGKQNQNCPWIKRPQLRDLGDLSSITKKANEIANKLCSESKVEHTFSIDPRAWMSCFGINDSEKQQSWDRKVIERTRELEAEHRKLRKAEKRTVMGKEKLINQEINLNYRPNRHGKRMLCISCDLQLRKSFIGMVKSLISRAKEVYDKWKTGDLSESFPIGLYPPSFPKHAEMLPSAFFAL